MYAAAAAAAAGMEVTPLAALIISGVCLPFLGFLTYSVWQQKGENRKAMAADATERNKLRVRLAELETETRTRLAAIEQRCTNRGENIDQLYRLVHKVDRSTTAIAAGLGVDLPGD